MNVEIDDGCNTVITSSLSNEIIQYSEVLPVGMSGTYVSDAGDIFEWSISSARVVPNPLAYQYCSPCSCVTCIPEFLCAEVTVLGHFLYDAYGMPTTDSVPEKTYTLTSLPFADCVWNFDASDINNSGDDVNIDLKVTIKKATEQVCGMDFTGAVTVLNLPNGAGVNSTSILLERALHVRKLHGTECVGDDGAEWTQGQPELLPCPEEDPNCPDPPPQRFFYIDYTFPMIADGLVVANVRIRDLACGSCVTCPPPIDPRCCPDLPDTLLVSASRSGESSTSGVLTRTPAGFSGSVTVPGCSGVLTLLLRCDPDLDPKWYLDVGGCHSAAALPNDGGDPVCDAFVFETSGVLLSGVSTCCLPDHPPVTIPIVITA